nr:ribose-phosphate pyrophosphokinase-like domain-containing protein [uncultured Desulfobulbus sp.]
MTNASPSSLCTPLIISGFSSQHLAHDIAECMKTRIVAINYKQFNDKEIQTTLEQNMRGHGVIVVASASGDPNKQEKEARLLLRAAKRSGAQHICLVLPYMWYGRSDDMWDERNAPALIDTIETLRPLCSSVVVADPHNAGLTREKFLDGNGNVETCTITHFAFPFAIQLKSMIEQGLIYRENLLPSHADAGSTKRISRSFRASLSYVLGLHGNPDQDDWPQGLKDRDKTTGKIKIKGFSSDVEGKDVVIFEDMVASGGTACDLAMLLKKQGARSVTLCATSGLFTTDPTKETATASIDRINASDLDVVFITDTYNHILTSPDIANAIEQSSIIHVIKTGKYLGAILSALHASAYNEESEDHNSVSALLKGHHPLQKATPYAVAQQTPVKSDNPLMLNIDGFVKGQKPECHAS